MARRSNHGIVHKFKVYLEKGQAPHWWMNVLVFDSHTAMWEYNKSQNGERGKYGAITYSYDKGGDRCLGELHFSRTDLTSGTIAHESSHAVFGYFMRKNETELIDMSGRKRDSAGRPEEWICERIDEVVSQVTQGVLLVRIAELDSKTA